MELIGSLDDKSEISTTGPRLPKLVSREFPSSDIRIKNRYDGPYTLYHNRMNSCNMIERKTIGIRNHNIGGLKVG
jgi:hypothetical protein